VRSTRSVSLVFDASVHKCKPSIHFQRTVLHTFVLLNYQTLRHETVGPHDLLPPIMLGVSQTVVATLLGVYEAQPKFLTTS